MAKELGIQLVMVELDAKVVVQLVNGNSILKDVLRGFFEVPSDAHLL